MGYYMDGDGAHQGSRPDDDEPRYFDRPRDDIDDAGMGEIDDDLPEPPPNECVDCGQETASEEGLCYECQTKHHGIDFDMDGQGWL